MYDITKENDKLCQNLKDAGLEETFIKEFMNLYHSEESTTWMRLLRSHRMHLLEDIHIMQERLFCLDYLIRNLKAKEKM